MDLPIKYRGRQATSEDVAFISQLIAANPDDSRRALSVKLCRALNWVQPNGTLRDMVCRGFMLELHRAGYITLPAKKCSPPNPFVDRKKPGQIGTDHSPISTGLKNIRPLKLRQVRKSRLEKLYNSLVEAYHYLGYCQPVGEHLKYIVFAGRRPIACLAWSSAARHIGCRDRFIGWSADNRRKHIHLMAYNTRFLILPWVRVPYLASHILAQMAKVLSVDWQRVYNHRVYYLETFVDKERFAGSLQDGDYEIIKGMAETLSILSQALDNKNTSIKRLLKLIFGDSTEKTAKVLKRNKAGGKNKKKKKRKGHGKNGAADYHGAEKIKVSHESLKPKDRCPECHKGKLYELTDPGIIVRVTGNAPCSATIYELQKLRCNLCQKIFTAQAPDNIGDEKYDAASGAMIALLKYGSGLPFNRLDQLQATLDVPLPSSTQWEIVESVADKIHPVYPALMHHAAGGEVVYNDDTVMKILELMKQSDEDRQGRKGMYTSGILSTVGDRKVAVFMTGGRHAGENLATILAKRSAALPPPVQMCDALSRNLPENFKTILANCLAHARRRFVDVEPNFPQECTYVLEILEEVYINDAVTKQQNMTPDQRLQYHQQKSAPLMDDLEDWLQQQFDDKKVEPNSSLGQAISYMLNHWEKLTLFLRVPKAPLDNNLCERALKKAILHRKNSLFYKTEHGAYIGDLFMSLIHTCNLCKVNPFEYLKTLQQHSSELFRDPGKWMPWNYEKSISPAAD